MSRNSNPKPLPQTTEMSALPKPRIPMHTTKIVYTEEMHGQSFYFAIHDRKVTVAFKFYPEDADIMVIDDVFGAYDGAARYYRSNNDKFKDIYIIKSPDDTVCAIHADKYQAENFIRQYIDKQTTRQLLNQAETEATPTSEETEA